MNVYEQIGERIRSIRKRNKDSQETLGKKINLSKSYLSKIENGKKQISIDDLKKIADLYNVHISYFFDAEKQNIDELDKHVEWIAFGKEMEQEDLTPKQVKEIKDFAERMRKDLENIIRNVE